MQIEILGNGLGQMAMIHLGAMDTLGVRSESKVFASPGVRTSPIQSSWLQAWMQRMRKRPSAIFQKVSTEGNGGTLALAPWFDGEVAILRPEGGWWIAADNVLAYDLGLSIEMTEREGIPFIRCAGAGPVVVASAGSVHSMTLEHGRTLDVFSGHLMAYSAHVTVEWLKTERTHPIEKALKVPTARIAGPGEIWLQSRPINKQIREWVRRWPLRLR